MSAVDNPNPGGSGVAATYYAVDDPNCTASTAGIAGCTTYTQPFTISGNGVHTLTYFSVDNAGNIEAANTTTIKIDTLAPTASPTLSGTQGNNGWYTGPVKVTWHWTDSTPGSGIDNSNCTKSSSYSGPDSATASVSATCQDKVGNIGSDSQTFKYDATPPVVQCTPPAATVWYDHNVTVDCSASDATSGLANANLASFSLTTSVATDTSNASASTGSQQVCDNAGNCAIAGPYTFMVDLAPPTITRPVPNGQYTVNQAVTLSCADVGSGINTCQVQVKLPSGSTTIVAMPNDLPTSQSAVYTVTPDSVTDVAGNADTTSFTYTVSYQVVSLPGSTTTVTQGYDALIRFAPEDANGHDEASRTLEVTAVELEGPNNQVIPFAYPFAYGTFGGKAGYQLELNTRNLSPGAWTLVIQLGSGKTATTGMVTFTVE